MSRHYYRARWREADYEASPEPHSLELWIRLRSPEPADGFEEVEPGCHVRTVPAAECTALHFVTTVCDWRGEQVQVLDERDGQVLLEYPGGSAHAAAELGMERVERGVYRLWAPRAEVTDIREYAISLDVGIDHF